MTAISNRAVANATDLEVIRLGADSAAVAFSVAAASADPAVAGHYPGFPVLPGLFLVEAVDHAVRQWAPPGRIPELAGMDRCRFHQPVHPGDRVFAEAAVSRDGDGLVVRGSVATNRGRAADLRLRYRLVDGPPAATHIGAE
ncbi:hypothetical protein J7E96_25915 [Streptomyces sp. ISL-96]|uniref:MaoC/PaaZ C-terminal domain-containing protein n=1 Tax=Streptomyces sp. ISL-96 TaxID=2819191 RepID=UPI001BE65136|nr:MaoC/PaaZ C-terminal domain-containing protein [Streptomyces sp. ISL-96]MBT2491904.1 hypothetical protein [Streptomyces sp. ISL-96]